MYLKSISIFVFIVLIGESFGLPDCGTRSKDFSSRETRILGGKYAKIGQYPWVVAILRTEDCVTFGQVCGGSVINEHWVLTAAHCVCPRNIEAYRILAGTNDLTQYEGPSSRMYRVSDIFINPNYSNFQMKDDIALVKMLTPIEISTGEKIYINRICLPSVDEAIGRNVVTAGWGHRNASSILWTKRLKKVRLQVVPTENCSQIYKDAFNYNGIDDRLICALREKFDTCNYDSGGPLMKKSKSGVYTLIGIVKGGGPICGETPGFYTKVSLYVPWIKEIMEQPEGMRSKFNEPLSFCYPVDRLHCLPRNFA